MRKEGFHPGVTVTYLDGKQHNYAPDRFTVDIHSDPHYIVATSLQSGHEEYDGATHVVYIPRYVVKDVEVIK